MTTSIDSFWHGTWQEEALSPSLPSSLPLTVLQVSQFAIGAGVALRTYPAVLAREGWLEVEAAGSDLRGMRGICLVGLVFCYMAVRNFSVSGGIGVA